MEDQFEFDESELYGDEGFPGDGERDTDEKQGGEDNEDEQSDNEVEAEASFEEDGADRPGSARPGSAASSTTHLDIGVDPAHRLGTSISVAAHARPPRRTISLPESNAKLGASAPINIPFMGTWRQGLNDARQAVPQTFVPPHELMRREDFNFSFTGASPSATLKREKLRNRNRILQQTGFLEPDKAEQRDGADSQHLPTLSSGGLSAAFGGRQFNGP